MISAERLTVARAEALALTRAKAAARQNAPDLATNPCWFARELLGHDLWHISEAVLNALTRPRARVAVKGSHASSKTFTAAEAVLWAPHAGGIAITTAPTARQVNRMVWGEIHSMYPRAQHRLRGELLKTPEFRISPDEYALGVSTDKGVQFQGWHARDGGFMLIVLDEAPGVPPSVYDAIEGVRAGGDVRVLALGNPDVPSGPFYDAFTAERSGWECFTIDALESPNFATAGGYLDLDELVSWDEDDPRLDANPRPYLVTRRFVWEKWREWGPQSPLWASKVRGAFPDQSEDSLISLRWIEDAKRREIAPDPADEWVAGIDVAGPGEDETVVIVRHGRDVMDVRGWANADPRDDVLQMLAGYPQIGRLNVDTIGQGYYFAKHLEDNGWRGKVGYVNVGEPPKNKPFVKPGRQVLRFKNLKAELYWSLRERFRDGEIAGTTDALLISQLASIRYDENLKGEVQIESKEEMQRRGVKSPDRAEALMLCFAPTPTPVLAGSDLATVVLDDTGRGPHPETGATEGREPPTRTDQGQWLPSDGRRRTGLWR